MKLLLILLGFFGPAVALKTNRSLQDLAKVDSLLERDDSIIAVHLSNQGASDFGLSDSVANVIKLITTRHFLGEGPQYVTIPTPDDPDETVALVQDLYNKGVRVFLGPDTSNQAIAVGEWSKDRAPDAAFFSFGATNPSIGLYNNIVQLAPSDNEMAQSLSTYLVMSGRSKLAIIHNDGVYASGTYSNDCSAYSPFISNKVWPISSRSVTS